MATCVREIENKLDDRMKIPVMERVSLLLREEVLRGLATRMGVRVVFPIKDQMWERGKREMNR